MIFYKMSFVGLSNIMDGELIRRKPVKRPHREVVSAAVIDSELLGKVVERIKTVTSIETLLVLPVAALHLTVVAGCVGTAELVADTKLSGGGFKEGWQVSPAVGKPVGEFKTVVGLDTFHTDTPAGVPLEQLFQKVHGGKGGLLWVGCQEAQAGKFINSGVLVQAQFWVGDATAWDHFHVHLDPLSWISHLLVRFWLVGGFLFRLWEQPQPPHHPEQAFQTAGVAPQPQTVP